jgi:activator of HSP90 ATPase
MGLTKAQLEALNDSSFPNNNVGAITPEILRNYNDEVILNTVNQDVYTTDSASFDNRIDGLATTSSVNAVSTSVGLLQTFSGSQYKADSASFSSRILAVTGSGGNVDTSSLVTTASFNAYTQSTANTIATLATTASVTALSTSITVTNNTQTNLINGKTYIGMHKTNGKFLSHVFRH